MGKELEKTKPIVETPLSWKHKTEKRRRYKFFKKLTMNGNER